MSQDSSYILCGPKQECNIPEESMGKYFFELLKNRNYNEVVNIDAITKNVLTSGKLLEDSVKLTAILRSLSVEKGDVVSIVSENSLNYYVPVLAALYMGVTVNPLNPSYTIGELKHTLLISKSKIIFCTEQVLETIIQVKDELQFIEKIIVMGQFEQDTADVRSYKNLLASSSVDIDQYKPEAVNYSEDGAFIVSSSGTTGLPKGVLITHKNLREAMSSYKTPECWNVTSEDTTVLVLPLFHMFGILVYLTAVITSMKVVLMDKFRPKEFLEAIQEYKATKLYAAPPLLLFLTRSPLIDSYDISSVNDILCSAAPIKKQLIDEAKKRLGSTIQIRQCYGLTEMCCVCTWQATDINKFGSVGKLIPGLKAKIWDPDTKNIVGPLKYGEICFKGSVAMKGYVGNPIATQKSFDEDGFYHTGDVGFYDKDEYFYLIDRIKEVIKYKGFQVSPSELEALISTHPEIEDSGVIGIPDERAGQVPLAFIVRKNGANVSEEEIAEYVSKRISIQKLLYGGVRFIDAIPRNPAGKILRRKLSEIYKTT